MENPKQSQRGGEGNVKTADLSATCSNKVPGKKSDLNPVGNITAKGNQNITGARSKTSTREKYAPLKSVTDLTSKDLSTYRTNKNKVPSSSTFSASKPSPKESQSSGLSREVSKKPRTIASSLIPVKKIDTKTERKGSNLELSSSIKKPSSTKKDTKTNQTSKQKGIDQKPGTVISFEKEFEEVLLNTPVKPSAHSGITFMPKTKFSPSKNIFAPPTDDSSKVGQSSSSQSTSQPSIGIPSLKLASKTLQVTSKDLIKEATEKTRTGLQSKTLGEKTLSKPTDKAISTKMLRSKTEVSISTGPGLGKRLQKVKSFSKPRELATKKPAHQAIFDLPAVVKEEPTVELPPVTSAHSGVPFKPKKRSAVAAVNIFAQNDTTDSTKK